MVKRKDLVGVGDDDYDVRRNEFMQCQDCGTEMGGTQGDFFSLPMDYIFHCFNCNSENIAIVRLVHKIVIVKQ